MDERFNDGTKMPYGWFAEGWSVDDGKAKAKATEDSGNNGMSGMGAGGDPGESTGMPGMGSMFGGDRLRTYLLTPPVQSEMVRNWCSASASPTQKASVST